MFRNLLILGFSGFFIGIHYNLAPGQNLLRYSTRAICSLIELSDAKGVCGYREPVKRTDWTTRQFRPVPDKRPGMTIAFYSSDPSTLASGASVRISPDALSAAILSGSLELDEIKKIADENEARWDALRELLKQKRISQLVPRPSKFGIGEDPYGIRTPLEKAPAPESAAQVSIGSERDAPEADDKSRYPILRQKRRVVREKATPEELQANEPTLDEAEQALQETEEKAITTKHGVDIGGFAL